MHVRARRHEKIPARPLLIDYGLAGMGLVLSRVDSGSAEARLVFLLIGYGLAGMRLMASTSSFLPLRPPFLVLTQEKEAKESQAPNRGQGSLPGAPGTPAKLAGYPARFPAPEGAVRDASQAGRVPG